MPRKYKLTYWGFEAKGETARMLFKLANQEFEDERIGFKYWFSKGKEESPMGYIPILQIDEDVLCQANAINRYLAEEFGYAGKTAWDRARATMIANSLEDLFMETKGHFAMYLYGKKEEAAKLIRIFHDERIVPFVKILQNILVENNGGDEWFVGDSITWADLIVFNMLQMYSRKEVGFVDEFWETVPKLKAHSDRVAAYPAIAKWIKEKPKSMELKL